MLSQGPIPRFVHGLFEYVAAAVLFAAPFVLAFEADAATATSLIAAVLVLILAASSEGSTGLVDQIPLTVHFTLDLVLALSLIAIPFVAGFSDETAPTAFFLASGVVHLLLTIGTRFRPRDRERRPGASPSSSGPPSLKDR